jgi:hypothetical protein
LDGFGKTNFVEKVAYLNLILAEHGEDIGGGSLRTLLWLLGLSRCHLALLSEDLSLL